MSAKRVDLYAIERKATDASIRVAIFGLACVIKALAPLHFPRRTR